jgi:NADPH:quinone reductase-like Zn-dependent oxidoreductase
MKAVEYAQFGPPDVLRLCEVDTPVPREDEVLIRVQAASVNFSDPAFTRGKPFAVRMMGAGLLKPRHGILGADIAGQVKAVGGEAKQFRPGDPVFGDISECGWGGFAEYVCARESALAAKPANLTFEEAAAVPQAAVTALHGLRDKGGVRAGQKVLVVGASGGVGTFAVQIAKALGAEVTGVCGTRNLEMVRSIGADHLIDYTREDFAASGPRYDLILAVKGYRSIYDYRRALNPRGVYVMVGGSGAQMLQAMLLGPWLSVAGDRKLGNLSSRPNQGDLVAVKELIESGKVKPVIDRRFPLSQLTEAIRYYEEGHASGKVVISVARNDLGRRQRPTDEGSRHENRR